MIFLSAVLLITGIALAFIYWQIQKSNHAVIPVEVREHLSRSLRHFEGVHSPSVTDLATALRGHGHDRAASAVEASWRPCFRLLAAPEDEASPRCRVGGAPDLPDIARWPQWNGVPLAFLAQLDLAELAELNPDTPLPRSGLLLFFYDADQQTWGFNPEDRESWRVLYFPEPFEPVAIDAWPAGLPAHGSYPLAPVLVEAGQSLPDDIIDLHLDGGTPLEQAVLVEIMDQYQECYEGAAHQVLGFPYSIQGDMRLECQLASNGIYCGDESGFKDPRAKALEAGAADWRLLLQVDTDDRAGMMWGDMGTLYFCIREQDLAAGRFDQVWMILQCA